MTGGLQWFEMLAVMALILVLAWWCSRALGGRWNRSFGKGRVRLLEQLPLGGDKRLVLVRYQGKEFLLGVSQAGIRTITSGPQTEEEEEETPFSRRLFEQLEKNGFRRRGKGEENE